MDPKLYKSLIQLGTAPIASVRDYLDQEDINPIVLLMELAITATDSTGTGGGGVPDGGLTGQLLAKNSPANGDATWHDLILKGGNANG